MSKYTKAIIAVVVAAFAGLTVWAVNSVPDAPDDTAPEHHVMTYDGNKITETKDGKVVWEMTADSIEVVAETKLASMNNVKCKYYTEDGKIAYLHGDKAVYNQANDDVDLLDNVKLLSTDGYVLNCNKVTWTAKEQKLTLDGEVKMKNIPQCVQATGDTMEITENFNVFKVKGKAHMGKNLPDIEVKILEISEADKAEYEAKVKEAEKKQANAPVPAKQ